MGKGEAGVLRLDDDKIGRMGFWTPPTDENRAIRKAEAESLSNDGAIWVASPWKPSYLGYIGRVPIAIGSYAENHFPPTIGRDPW